MLFDKQPQMKQGSVLLPASDKDDYEVSRDNARDATIELYTVICGLIYESEQYKLTDVRILLDNTYVVQHEGLDYTLSVTPPITQQNRYYRVELTKEDSASESHSIYIDDETLPYLDKYCIARANCIKAADSNN
jgi:hypothetical protein